MSKNRQVEETLNAVRADIVGVTGAISGILQRLNAATSEKVRKALNESIQQALQQARQLEQRWATVTSQLLVTQDGSQPIPGQLKAADKEKVAQKFEEQTRRIYQANLQAYNDFKAKKQALVDAAKNLKVDASETKKPSLKR